MLTNEDKNWIAEKLETELEKKLGKSIPIQEILNEASSKGIEDSRVEEIIDKMKRDGVVFEPKRGFLSKI